MVWTTSVPTTVIALMLCDSTATTPTLACAARYYTGVQMRAVVYTNLVCPALMPMMSCSWQQYDFSALAATDMLLPYAGGVAAFRPCATVSASFCAGIGNGTLGMFCTQSAINTTAVTANTTVLATPYATSVVWSLLPNSTGVQWQMQNGETCVKNGTNLAYLRRLTVQFYCSAAAPAVLYSLREVGPFCDHVAVVYTQLACSCSSPRTGPPAIILSSTSSRSLPFFSSSSSFSSSASSSSSPLPSSSSSSFSAWSPSASSSALCSAMSSSPPSSSSVNSHSSFSSTSRSTSSTAGLSLLSISPSVSTSPSSSSTPLVSFTSSSSSSSSSSTSTIVSPSTYSSSTATSTAGVAEVRRSDGSRWTMRWRRVAEILPRPGSSVGGADSVSVEVQPVWR